MNHLRSGDTMPDWLVTEFIFTPLASSCRNPHATDEGELRCCRRPAGHPDGPHASGWPLIVW